MVTKNSFEFYCLKMEFNCYRSRQFISVIHEDRAFLTWGLSGSIWSASSNSLFAWSSSFNFSLLLLGRKWERSCSATPHLNKAAKGANRSKKILTNCSRGAENTNSWNGFCAPSSTFQIYTEYLNKTKTKKEEEEDRPMIKKKTDN